MKKEDNSFGVASVILGIFSILSAYPPLHGIILGVIALIFGIKQQKLSPNKWGRRGKVLAIIGIVISVLFFIALFWLSQNPEILSQLSGGYANA
ncbi:MAG: hypothetical protein ABII03_06210 [Nanoarchaeota archaeon]